MVSREQILLTLKLVAAKAAKLAHDYEHSQLWEGELSNGIAELKSELSKVNVNRSDC